MNIDEFPLSILNIDIVKFEKLNYSQQVENLKELLDKANKLQKYFIKEQIRWRSNIEAGKEYDYNRIMEFMSTINKKEEKLNYLRLIRKNIRQQLDAMKQDSLFEIFVYEGGASFALKSNDSDLNDYLMHIWELWLLSAENFMPRENILDYLGERTELLKKLKRKLKHEINYLEKVKEESKQTTIEKNNDENIKDIPSSPSRHGEIENAQQVVNEDTLENPKIKGLYTLAIQ